MAEAITILGVAAGVTQAVSQAKPVFWDPLMTKGNLSENVEEIHYYLKDAVNNLGSVKMDFKNEVEGNKMKKPSEAYLEWNRRVMMIEEEVEKLVTDYKKRNKLPFRSGFKEKMKKMYKRVINLRDEGDQIRERILVNRPPETVVNMRAPDIKNFDTLQKSLEQILDLLKGNKVQGIRIHGPLGIGKTTIMLNLNKHEQVAEMFDIVIWLKVSKEGSKENLSRKCLQQDIVQRLQLNMGDTNNADEVAQRIFTELKDKNCLLLLDDVKDNINLDEIGIPCSNNGSKIVLTTRLHHVCSSMVKKEIKVTYLSTDEAWRMFRDVLGSPELVENPEIERLAWRVCKECGGLPLLIEKVAKTFKLKNDMYLWSEGLNSWRMWPAKECQGIREMYELLKFCYDDLDEEQKKCFLYGALYPEDIDINTNSLLECWAAEDLLGNDHGKTKKSVVVAHCILNRLMNVSLLEEGKSENHVTMHKFMRQVAFYIAEDIPECKYLVQTNRSLREAPDVESWSDKNRISLGDNELVWLPDSPCCTMLSTLFLQKNLDLSKIPELFFEHMKNLRVLDLSHTGIILLPSSISMLISLKNLYLNDCKDLMELPSDIGELAQLEALDIRGSGVNNIPPHIEKLIHLRRLLVSFTKLRNGNATQEVAFGYNMISKLSRLEELVIDMKSPEQWSNEVVENIIKEVASLKELKILKFCISNKVVDFIKLVDMNLNICLSEATSLQSFMERSSRRNIQSIRFFYIFIGCQNSEHPEIPGFFKYDRYIKYCNGAGSNFPTLDVLARADAFELVNHKDIKHLSDFGIASMKKVLGCLVESCDAIETIVGTVDSADPVLPNLKDLYIKNLPRLESICKGPMQPRSLTKLTTLHLTSCQMMVKIFPLGVIQQLHELQYLRIEKCQEIEEIIAESDTAGNLNLLPKLKELILLEMQKLRSVCVIESLEWRSLEKIGILNCSVLFKLPFNKKNAAKLQTIEAEQQWWEALQWQNGEVKERLQQLFTFSP